MGVLQWPRKIESKIGKRMCGCRKANSAATLVTMSGARYSLGSKYPIKPSKAQSKHGYKFQKRETAALSGLRKEARC